MEYLDDRALDVSWHELGQPIACSAGLRRVRGPFPVWVAGQAGDGDDSAVVLADRTGPEREYIHPFSEVYLGDSKGRTEELTCILDLCG